MHICMQITMVLLEGDLVCDAVIRAGRAAVLSLLSAVHEMGCVRAAAHDRCTTGTPSTDAIVSGIGVRNSIVLGFIAAAAALWSFVRIGDALPILEEQAGIVAQSARPRQRTRVALIESSECRIHGAHGARSESRRHRWSHDDGRCIWLWCCQYAHEILGVLYAVCHERDWIGLDWIGLDWIGLVD